MRSWTDAALLIGLLIMLLWGIAGFGIWDPWELQVADAIRGRLSDADLSQLRPPGADALVSAAFDAFGVRAWAGRLPAALGGWLCAVLAWRLARGEGRVAGLVAAIATVCCPLLLFNARLINGLAPAFAAQAAVALIAGHWTQSRSRTRGFNIAAGVALAGATLLSIWLSGVLMGPLAPLVAVTVVRWSQDRDRTPVCDNIGVWAASATVVIMLVGVVRDVVADAAQYSTWLGGGALGTEPPTFDAGLEQLFHGFAPWSALLVLAVLALPASIDSARRPNSQAADGTLGIVGLWAALSYVTTTVFASRYGAAVFPAVVALGVIVGVLVARLQASEQTHWFAAVLVSLLVGLLVRDYALYPDAPLGVIAAESVSAPEGFHRRLPWIVMLTTFGVCAAMGLTIRNGDPGSEPRHPNTRTNLRRFVETQWNRGTPFKAWIVMIVAACAALSLFGILGSLNALPGPSVVSRIATRVLSALVGTAVLLALLPPTLRALGSYAHHRMAPTVLAGAAMGVFVTGFFQPALSEHFSPKDIFERWNNIAAPETQPIGAFGVATTAADYYIDAPVQQLKTKNDLIEFLLEPGQHWAVFPAEQLPAINREVRRRRGTHLFVADATSKRMVLAAGQPVAGMPNENFLADVVLEKRPTPMHPVDANFDDRVRLIGYDLTTPRKNGVGGGEFFDITWYWHCVGAPPAGHKVFVHIDAYGNRIHGDHDPVQDRLPTGMWQKGDIVADKQTLKVPSNFRAGAYTIYVGFFVGSKRLKVKVGDHDGKDRLKAGTLTVL